MKHTKSVAVAVFAAITLAIAGSAGAGGQNATAAHSANHGAFTNQAGMRSRNRRFFNSNSAFPYYGYGNAIVLNPDEADWQEQWLSLYEDNDGPYARSTRENPPGEARMWEF